MSRLARLCSDASCAIQLTHEFPESAMLNGDKLVVRDGTLLLIRSVALSDLPEEILDAVVALLGPAFPRLVAETHDPDEDPVRNLPPPLPRPQIVH